MSETLKEKNHALERLFYKFNFYDRFIAPIAFEVSNQFKDKYLSDFNNDAKILDVGCGGAQLAIEMAFNRKDLRITGIDLSSKQIERAQKRAQEKGVDVQLIVGSASDMPFKDNSFDCVYTIGSIKHWSNKKDGIKECIRVLKNNGKLIIAEVNKLCAKDKAILFVNSWKIPKFFKGFGLRFFLSQVVNKSISVADIQDLMKSFNLQNSNIEIIYNDLFWVLTANK